MEIKVSKIETMCSKVLFKSTNYLFESFDEGINENVNLKHFIILVLQSSEKEGVRYSLLRMLLLGEYVGFYLFDVYFALLSILLINMLMFLQTLRM